MSVSEVKSNELNCSYDNWYVSLFHNLLLLFLLAAIFNREDDIGTYTIRAVDDPRTLNKILYLRPPGNIYSFNELVSLWEKKIGKTLEKIYVPEEKMLKDIQGQWENPSSTPSLLQQNVMMITFNEWLIFLCSFMFFKRTIIFLHSLFI